MLFLHLYLMLLKSFVLYLLQHAIWLIMTWNNSSSVQKLMQLEKLKTGYTVFLGWHFMEVGITSVSDYLFVKQLFKICLLGWPSGDSTLYQRVSHRRFEKVPWGSTTASPYHIWTKISTCNRWEVFDVCIRPESARNATQPKLELYFCSLLQSFSLTESTGKMFYFVVLKQLGWSIMSAEYWEITIVVCRWQAWSRKVHGK